MATEVTIIKDQKLVEYTGDKKEALSYCQELGLFGFKLRKAIPWNMTFYNPNNVWPTHPRSYREYLIRCETTLYGKSDYAKETIIRKPR